jgi:AcrR family transcriptional regulator
MRTGAVGAKAQRNLSGQRLGRKGRETRSRIIAAVGRLVSEPNAQPLSLSAIARETSVTLTTLYLYFADLGELVLAALEPVVAELHPLVAMLETRWPDEDLGACCVKFIDAYAQYWANHSHLLHLRNKFAAERDVRFYQLQLRSSRPLLNALARQMDGDGEQLGPALYTAAFLLTGVERFATVLTDRDVRYLVYDSVAKGLEEPVRSRVRIAEARVLELAIRDQREQTTKGLKSTSSRGGKKPGGRPGCA